MPSKIYTARPDFRYCWLNIRGLPTDPAADYAPSGGRVVVGMEWFGSKDSISSGSKLDIKEAKISSDSVTIQLIDRNVGVRAHYLRGLFQAGPQETARIVGQDIGGGWIVEGDIVDSTPQSLWTSMGECVRCTGAAADDDGDMVYTLTRAYNDTEFVTGSDAVLLPGMLLYKYPVLSTLFAELWTEDHDGTQTMQYCGIISTVTHDPSGLGIALRISDMVTGTTLPKTAFGVVSGLIPFAWVPTYDGVVDGYKQTTWRRCTSADARRLMRVDGMSMPGTECTGLSLSTRAMGGVSIQATWRESPTIDNVGSRAKVRFIVEDFTGSADGWTDVDDLGGQMFAPHKFVFRYVGPDLPQMLADPESIGSEFSITFDEVSIAQSPEWLIPLERDPSPDLYSNAGELFSPFENRNGYADFPQIFDDGATGYWDTWAFGTREPAFFVKIGDKRQEITGVRRAVVRGAGGTITYTDAMVTPGFAVHSAGDDVVELLPAAAGAWVSPQISSDIDSSVTNFVTGGRVDAAAWAPWKGLGIPASYVDIDLPDLGGMAVTGWDACESIREWLRGLMISTGCALGCSTDGVVSVAGFLRSPADGQAGSSKTLNISELLAPPSVSMELPAVGRLVGKMSDGTTITVTAIDATSRDSQEFEMPAFIDTASAAEFLGRLLPLVSRPRSMVTLRCLASDVGAVQAGGHIRLTGTMPGNTYDSDTVDNFALITSVKRGIFSDSLELVVMLLPEYDTTYGYHWGSPMEGFDGSKIYLARSYGADFTTIYPPGIYADDSELRLVDCQGVCDDYFEATPSARAAFSGVDCYRLSCTYIVSTPTTRALHPVVDAGADWVDIAGNYVYQFPRGLECRASGGTPRAAISAVTYDSGTSRTRITADWASVPTTSHLVWSESIMVTPAVYGDCDAASQYHYFFDDSANAAISMTYAPGNMVWEVADFNAVSKTLVVSGDIRADFKGVSVSRPVRLTFDDPAVKTAAGNLLKVTGVSYSSGGDDETTLQVGTPWALGVVDMGDTFRDARQGTVRLFDRPGSVKTYQYK